MNATADGPRLMIYSQDGLGLGHLRRTTLLAAEFLAARPNGSVLTICDSPVGQFFTPADNHDYLKLPSVRKLSPGNWAPVSLAMPFAEVLALRKATIRTAALSFAPDVMLVDHMPHGAMGELVPTLEALESSSTRIVLGLRDILDAPATIRRRWQIEGAFQAVERFFDNVLVYGSREVFDLAREYAWPTHLRERLRYCGYVCSNRSPARAESIRASYLRNGSNGKLIVAMAGGGADGFPLFDALLRALPDVLADQRCTVVVVTGPFLPDSERARLEHLAQGLPVHLLTKVDDALSHLAAADLVVGMAGYNTTAEILAVRARALLVPRPGPSAEQQIRASSFARRGWVRWLPPGALSPESLAEAMVSALDAEPDPVTAGPDLRGRKRAARHLLHQRLQAAVNGTGSGLVMTRDRGAPVIPAQLPGQA